MNHKTLPEFWHHYRRVPKGIKELADKNFKLLKADSRHPSLHFKRIGELWSVRVGLHHRALPLNDLPDCVVWFWIGHLDEYDHLTESNDSGSISAQSAQAVCRIDGEC